MVAAEQDAVADIGRPTVPLPVLDVMRFGPRRRSVTSGPPAAAVAHGEGLPLATGEESLFAAHIKRCAVGIHGDPHRRTTARQALDRLDGYPVLLALERPVAHAV